MSQPEQTFSEAQLQQLTQLISTVLDNRRREETQNQPGPPGTQLADDGVLFSPRRTQLPANL